MVKIFPDFPLQDPPKFTQTGIFGLKTKHLATQEETGEGDWDASDGILIRFIRAQKSKTYLPLSFICHFKRREKKTLNFFTFFGEKNRIWKTLINWFRNWKCCFEKQAEILVL
jgi:hypothetical protein